MKVTVSKVVLAVMLAGLAQVSHATNFGGGDTTNNNQTYNHGGDATAVAGAVAGAANFNDISNKQQQGQAQGQLQGQAQGQVNGNADNKQTTTVEGDTYKAPDIPVSTAYAPSIAPTAPCMGSTSGGAQGMGFGISLGSSWTSEECLILETARSFDNANARDDAMAVRCQAKYAKAAPSCQALSKAASTTPAKVSAVRATTKVAAKEAYTPVKSIPPTISSNGYYSVVANPLAQ